MLFCLLHCNPDKNQSTRGPTASSERLGSAWDLSGEDRGEMFPTDWVQQHLEFNIKAM